MPVAGLEAVARAILATDRKGLGRFARAHRLPLQSRDERRSALALFNEATPLLALDVANAARQLLVSARGPMPEKLTWTVWPSVERTHFGKEHRGTWSDFDGWHRHETALVAAKGAGTTYNPTKNTDGHRQNASTIEMYMLLLDCDGTGTWNHLLDVLAGLQLAYLAHQSGGYTEQTPKWRIALPLASPFKTSGQEGQRGWRFAYAAARVIFGALAQLRGPGFDCATDGPFHSWYPGTRRSPTDELRRVVVGAGQALDLPALVDPIPQLPEMGRGRQGHAPWRASFRGAAQLPVTPSLLERAFAEAGMLGRALSQEKVAVLCPWNEHHSEPLHDGQAPTSATVLFRSADGRGRFFCFHSCCGTQTPEDVLAALPRGAVANAVSSFSESPASPGPPRPPPRLRDDFAFVPRGLPRGLRHRF